MIQRWKMEETEMGSMLAAKEGSWVRYADHIERYKGHLGALHTLSSGIDMLSARFARLYPKYVDPATIQPKSVDDFLEEQTNRILMMVHSLDEATKNDPDHPQNAVGGHSFTFAECGGGLLRGEIIPNNERFFANGITTDAKGNLIKDDPVVEWAKGHYWDSLEKDRDLIIEHIGNRFKEL